MTNIVTLDIETAPNVADVWGLWKNDVALVQLHETSRMISFAAKWHGKPRVEFRSEFHDGHAEMVARAHELLSQADIVVHFNGERFDIPHLNREFLLAGLNPPAPFQQVDLLRVARKAFSFPSYKLAHITAVLGLSGKLTHSGHTLWVKCLREQDPKAWALMRRYNMQDVRTTEELYDRLLAWVPSHPHMGLLNGEVNACARCGGLELQRRGRAYTKLGAYQRFQCQGCGSWSRGKRAELSADARGIAS